MQKLDQVIEVPLHDGLVLHVTHMDERKGRVRLALLNGEIKTADELNPSRSAERVRFIKDAKEAEPNVNSATLLDALLDISEAVAAGDPTSAEEPPEPAPDPAELERLAAPLLSAPDLLDQLRDAVHRFGLVGEDRNALATYLMLTARVLKKLVNEVVKGPSSAGKSYLVQTVLALFPPAAYVDLTTITPKALVYDDAPLSHRVLVLYEAGALGRPDTPEGEALAYAVRSLLSEGRLCHSTVEKGDDGKLVTRRIEREGPTSLLTTTTKVALDGELETRLLELNARDDSEQTRAVLKETARHADGTAPEPPDVRPWQALQTILQQQAPFVVVVPFASALAEKLPADAVRMRRDFNTLLALIQASAVLHHRQRAKDSAGRLRASIDDYKVVYDLLADTYAATTNQGCTESVRRAVEAVAALCDAAGLQPDPKAAGGVTYATVTVRQVAKHLNVDRSVAQRALTKALDEGWLIDDSEGKRGKPRRYRPGEDLPAPRSALPAPEDVAATRPDDDPPDGGEGAQGCAGVQKVCNAPCTPSTPRTSPSGQGCAGVQPDSEGARHASTPTPDTRPITRWRPDPDGWDGQGRQYLPDDTPTERYALDVAGLTIGLELDGRRYVMRPPASADDVEGWEEL